jgi:hypothetical protein
MKSLSHFFKFRLLLNGSNIAHMAIANTKAPAQLMHMAKNASLHTRRPKDHSFITK